MMMSIKPLPEIITLLENSARVQRVGTFSLIAVMAYLEMFFLLIGIGILMGHIPLPSDWDMLLIGGGIFLLVLIMMPLLILKLIKDGTQVKRVVDALKYAHSHIIWIYEAPKKKNTVVFGLQDGQLYPLHVNSGKAFEVVATLKAHLTEPRFGYSKEYLETFQNYQAKSNTSHAQQASKK
jgi:hypothetical protein